MRINMLYAVSKRILLPITLAPIFFIGCQKVVSIDLNNANPRLVIEGIVTDQPGPYSVKLSMSGDYFAPSLHFPPVSNAVIIVTDNFGQIDTLKEAASGTYLSSTLLGVAGSTYTMFVNSEGKQYNATSSMPKKVFIDSLYALVRNASRGEGPGYDIYVSFKDPPEPGNYYRINATSSVVIPTDSIDGRRYRLYTDKLTNGNEMMERIRAGRLVVAGDTITISLYSIDKAAYDYFNTLNDILISDRAPTSLSPANPTTNISNGSLGYFAAYTIDTKWIVLK
ncbi:MAG: DUF4249 domain-containing protein [Bacteroidota bacterium]